MGWSGVAGGALKLARSPWAWAVAAIAGLALSLWVVTVERDRARDQIEARDQRIDILAAELADLNGRLTTAQLDRESAEDALAIYAQETFAAFQAQAEAARRTAAELAELNRRVRAANLEISHADAGLRLDDPLPDGVRNALACAGGDERACAAAPAADSGRVPAAPDDAAVEPRRTSREPDGA